MIDIIDRHRTKPLGSSEQFTQMVDEIIEKHGPVQAWVLSYPRSVHDFSVVPHTCNYAVEPGAAGLIASIWVELI